MDCRVVAAANLWGLVGVGGVSQIGGGFSHESEHDLAMMVSDFLENGSSGAESWCSSDSESGSSDFAQLAEKIQICKLSAVKYESDLLSVVHSLILSMNEANLRSINSSPCYGSCIRFYLVELLRLSGYDAGVCASKWQASGKVPGGDNEYIEVVGDNFGTSERLIIDIDFQSHFEIAKAVDSYDRILNSLPVVYVGSFSRLKQFLGIMVDAARSSLKQNSMPLPPWRSLAYLQAKWQPPYQRYTRLEGNNMSNDNNPFNHGQCCGVLKKLQASLQSEMEAERMLKPRNKEINWRMMKPDRCRHSKFGHL
ncbi:hypothetical protein QN277_011585 [Acacia crassicarpa]|uniref:Plant-specific domain TIGR01615 family protein n=1 Tax=Acacia crassicarpa TaxID=499986 RepID=A0AAE1MZC3_9FABA|nr:hypothetical protein QN277_011585 [Acacia crassicarpa]